MNHKQYKNKLVVKAVESTVFLGVLLFAILSTLPIYERIYQNNRYRLETKKVVAKYAYADDSKIGIYKIASIANTSTVLGLTVENNDSKSIPVINYHGIVDSVNDIEDVSWKNFVEQMNALKDAGYKTVTLKEFKDFVDGKTSLPNKSILITFDDGRKDSYYPVDKVLKSLGFNAVMYIINERVDNSSFHLNSKEISEMLKTGRWEIGSHSDQAHKSINIDSVGNQGHWLSNKMWLSSENRLETDDEYTKRIYDDFKVSKNKLSDKFSEDVSSYAIPYGDFGQDGSNFKGSKNLILQASKDIYKTIMYQPWGEIGFRNYPNKDTFMIRRYTVHSTDDATSLISILDSSNDKDLPYRIGFGNKFNLIGVWGGYEVNNESITLSSKDNTSGSLVYINGSESWDNTKMDVVISKVEDVDSISLIARADRKGNYSYCNFSKDGVGYYEKILGETIKKNFWKRNVYLDPGTKLSIITNMNEVKCLTNDFVLVSDKQQFIKQEAGMAGISIWSKLGDGHGKLEVKSIYAEKVY